MKVSVSFQQGKQNQDIDEMFIANGEYRELINGRVLDSDTENSGCITSLKGTEELFNEPLVADFYYKAIAITSHEDLLYVFFASSLFGNVIKEYDTINKTSSIVFVDAHTTINSETYPELYNYFIGNNVAYNGFIHFTNIGVNSDVTMHVYEGMLFFHDREDEPFKINIERAKTLNYYTRKEQITVAKVPPQAPYVSTNVDEDSIQNFNAGDYKFGLRYVYDNGEISAVSPLSSMPIATCEVHPETSAITTGGYLEIEEKYLDLEQTDIPGTYYDVVDYNMAGMYRLTTLFSKNNSGDLRYSFSLKRDGEVVDTGAISFTEIQGKYPQSSFEVFPIANVSYPIVASFSASRKDDGQDVIAWVVNPRWGYIKEENSFNYSKVFIYNRSTGQGYFYRRDSSAWFHSVCVTKQGDVYVSVKKGDRYRLWKFNFTTEQFVEVLGTTSITVVDHQIAKTRTIAANDNGNIVYYAHSRNDATMLFQSKKNGEKSSFQMIANRDLMFGENLQYIKDFKGDQQNLWSISTCCSADGMIIYVGCCNCIARSEDAGNTWASYIIDGNITQYGAVIDLQCSSDGKTVYAVVGAADNANVEIKYDSSNDSVEDENTFIPYSGNLYVSHSFGKSFTRVEPSTGLLYPGENPSASRIRSITCSDSGSVVIAKGWAWSYYKKEGENTYSLTDLLNTGGYTAPTTNTFMSVNYGSSMFVTQSFGTFYNIKHDFTAKNEDFEAIYNRFSALFDYSYVAHNRSANDIRHTKLENNVSSVNIYIECNDPHVDRVQIIMSHNGTYYIVNDIERTKIKNPFVFANDGIYSVLPEKDANKLYDNVPLKANSSDIAQNALFFGGYTDGYDAIDVSGVTATEEYADFVPDGINISLKGGEKYNYGLIAYDKYNRSTGVSIIGSINPKSICDLQENQVKLAKITFPTDFTFPSWVSHFKICRTKTRNNFHIINGFDSVKVLNDKIFLEVTYNTSVVPNIGDTIELIYDWTDQEYKTFKIPVLGYIDNKSGVYSGEYSADEKLVGDGRYIIVSDNDIEHYNRNAVIMDDEHFTSSIFYINSMVDTGSDITYYEIPYTFSVVNGKADAEIYDATHNSPKIKGEGYVYTLYGDGDVILHHEPYREINIFSNGNRFTTLGRVALYSEYNKQLYRKASICVSEPFVQDTGFNGLSSFNTALINYKDLDILYGDIEAIDGLDDKIAVFQKYRCSQVQYRKNILSTATGDALVSKTQDIFGEQVFYALEYGLTNYRSLVKWGNARFFADQKRGCVLRIDYNGIHNISNNGMRNYFYKNLSNYTGKILACYDVAHSSYMLFHSVECNVICDNYYTPNDGWSARYEINPDIIINTMNGVFSFKGSKLYKHDVLDAPTIYEEDKDVTLRIPCNSNPNIIKDFNAIQVDSTTAPVFSRFKTRTGESTMGAESFEKTETAYQSYVPMVSGTIVSNPVLCCMTDISYSANTTARFGVPSTVDLHKDDAIIACQADSNGVFKQLGVVGRIVSVQPTQIVVLLSNQVSRGTALFAIDDSQTNGHAHKDTAMMVELKFSSATVVKSITMDINESKI